ncbi:MAG: lysozyme [Bacteroidales bacterium]|nr:lysozyme [Bacteroidales bacterium]
MPSTNPRNIKEIIVHYSATPQGENFTVEQIRQMHLAKGWSDIGYHWYIDVDGNIFKGRDENLTGAHTVGHNTISIGICYCGGCPPRSVKDWQKTGLDTRTPAQKTAILKLLKELKQRYPKATIHGHNEFAKKPCPGFNAKEEYKNL